MGLSKNKPTCDNAFRRRCIEVARSVLFAPAGIFFKEKAFQKRHVPLHLCKLQLSIKIFVPGQSFPPHFGAGLEHVRARVLFPPPHVTLHDCHDDH